MAEHPSADTLIGGFLSRLRDSGEGAFNRLSEQLLENPVFLDALRRTLEAKGQVDRTISGTLDLMQLPSKNDTARVTEMLEEISTRVAKQQRMLTQIEQDVAVVKALVERLTATRTRRTPK